MNSKKFAFYGGILMLFMGLFALLPGLSQDQYGLPEINLEVSYGLFLGIFPMNILNKLALIGFGLAGIWSYRASADGAHPTLIYSRAVFYVMGALALLGLFSTTNTLFGYWPLFGNEVVAHAVFALLGGYYGFFGSPEPFRHSPLRRV